MSAQPRPPRHAPTVAESTKELTAEGARVTTTVTGSATTAPAPPEPPRAKRMAGSLGVLRLDYDYPPAPGDIDHPFSFAYDVFYRVVPGLTFEICQAGAMPADVEARFVEKVQELDALGVSGITGDCGFMMYFQALARRHTKKPVFMSALAVLPAVTCAYAPSEKVAIFTANGRSLEPMRALIRDECGVDTQGERYVVVGCEDVPHFDAVAKGEKVDTEKVQPGIVARAEAVLAAEPRVRAILMECTELPPYFDAVRAATGPRSTTPSPRATFSSRASRTTSASASRAGSRGPGRAPGPLRVRPARQGEEQEAPRSTDRRPRPAPGARLSEREFM